MTTRALPLGIRIDRPLTSDQMERLGILESYDLAYIEDRLLTKGLLPASWIEQAVFEFRRFIGLGIVHGRGQGMFSPYVDEVWHQAILFTQEYFAFSEAVSGQYIHHAPDSGDDAGNDESDNVGVEQFKLLYEQTYGPLPEFWTLHVHEA